MKIIQELRVEISALAELSLNIAEASGQDRDELKKKYDGFLRVQRNLLSEFPPPGEGDPGKAGN